MIKTSRAATQPAEMLSTSTGHEIASTIFLNGFAAFWTGFGVGSNPVHCFTVIHAFTFPGRPHFTCTWGMRLRQTGKTKLQSTETDWFTDFISNIPDGIATIGNTGTPFDVAVIVDVRFQQHSLITFSDRMSIQQLQNLHHIHRKLEGSCTNDVFIADGTAFESHAFQSTGIAILNLHF